MRRPRQSPLCIGLALGLTTFIAYAEETGDSRTKANQAVLDAWQQTSGETATPVLAQQPDGSMRIEWRTNINLETYRNDVVAQNSAASGLKEGNFGKAAVTAEVRLVEPSGDFNYLQFGVNASNDRSFISRYPHQLMNFQGGANRQLWQAGTGDMTSNFSSLGTSLGMRGLSFTRSFDTVKLTAFGGVVAESWEALLNRTPLDTSPIRSRYLREVYGSKLEKAISPAWRAYVTLQGFSDRNTSLPEELRSLSPASSRAATTGFAYQEGNVSLTGEFAGSRYSETNGTERTGRGALLDTTYRASVWSLRGGYHNVDPGYVSLAQSVPPGVREYYAGADWSGLSWLNTGIDYRNAQSRSLTPILLTTPLDPALPTPAPTYEIKLVSRSETFSGRLNFNVATWLPGWSLGLQGSDTTNKDANANNTRTANGTANIGYASSGWNIGLMLGKGLSSTVISPQSDSRMTNLQTNMGYNYQRLVDGVSMWSLGATLSLGWQKQEMYNAGTETRSQTQTLSLNGQRPGLGQFNLNATRSANTPPMGGQKFVMTSIQAEAGTTFLEKHSFKAYLRTTKRTSGQAATDVTENTAGVQVNIVW